MLRGCAVARLRGSFEFLSGVDWLGNDVIEVEPEFEETERQARDGRTTHNASVCLYITPDTVAPALADVERLRVLVFHGPESASKHELLAWLRGADILADARTVVRWFRARTGRSMSASAARSAGRTRRLRSSALILDRLPEPRTSSGGRGARCRHHRMRRAIRRVGVHDRSTGRARRGGPRGDRRGAWHRAVLEAARGDGARGRRAAPRPGRVPSAVARAHREQACGRAPKRAGHRGGPMAARGRPRSRQPGSERSSTCSRATSRPQRGCSRRHRASAGRAASILGTCCSRCSRVSWVGRSSYRPREPTRCHSAARTSMSSK